ncbi:hypothetical protein XHV734_1122 [Xanthomonas hortorum pv. vitians]|nr:hypothetical protein XHV734_1122 [Xanthomonas hortorum pv. vitians]
MKSRRPSASAQSAKRWNGPPPKWSPTKTCPRTTIDCSHRCDRSEQPALCGLFSFAGRFRARSAQTFAVTAPLA